MGGGSGIGGEVAFVVVVCSAGKRGKVVSLALASALLGAASPELVGTLADAALQGLAVAANGLASSPLALVRTPFVEQDVPIGRLTGIAASSCWVSTLSAGSCEKRRRFRLDLFYYW